MEVFFVDEAIPVLVDHVERLLELLDLGLIEHGEDVGRGPLGALLGVLPLGSLAGHFGCCLVPLLKCRRRDRLKLRAPIIRVS